MQALSSYGIAPLKNVCNGIGMAADPESVNALKERLELTRLALGFTSKKAFADSIGITQQKWYNYTTGPEVPPYGHLLTICRLYGLTTDWLLRGSLRDLPADFRRALARLQTEPRPERQKKSARAQ